MSVKNYVLVGFGLLVFIGLTMFFYDMSVDNKVIAKREAFLAQDNVRKANYDKMFKVVAQTAEIPDHFMEQAKVAFKEIYTPLMEGRYSNDRGGALMSWISEHNPKFDLNSFGKLYERLQVTIEANREQFFVEQKKLIDIKRDYDVYINQKPVKWFVNDGLKPLELKLITSTKTEKVFKSGVEDDINLFKD